MRARTYIVAASLMAIAIAALLINRTTSLDLAILVPNLVTYDRVPYDVSVSRNKESLLPGDFARHRFVIKQDGNLAPLLDNLIYPHVAIVSDDLSDVTFYHVDRLASPREGVYEFDHQFTARSDYTLWFELNDNTGEDHHGDESNYTSRVDVPITVTPQATPPTAFKTEAQDREYTLRLESGVLQAGRPGLVRISVENANGSPVEILQNYEQHFYYIADPKNDYYVLDHFDETLAQPSSVAAQLTAPTPGTYALWGRIFLSDDSGSAIDLVEGSFTLSVQ